eukprot:gene1431-12050_t
MSKILQATFKVNQLDKSSSYFTNYFGGKTVSKEKNEETLKFGKSQTSLKFVEDKDVKVGTGYGHLCFLSDDIYLSCKNMAQEGQKVSREPGPVKGGKTVIAFVLDPEDKKIEYIQKSEDRELTSEFNHIMLRVGDLEKSVEFYKKLGMKELSRSVNEQYKYTLSFVGFDKSETVLELTHNWGTDSYELGNCLDSITILSDRDEELTDPTGYKIKLVSKE